MQGINKDAVVSSLKLNHICVHLQLQDLIVLWIALTRESTSWVSWQVCKRNLLHGSLFLCEWREGWWLNKWFCFIGIIQSYVDDTRTCMINSTSFQCVPCVSLFTLPVAFMRLCIKGSYQMNYCIIVTGCVCVYMPCMGLHVMCSYVVFKYRPESWKQRSMKMVRHTCDVHIHDRQLVAVTAQFGSVALWLLAFNWTGAGL